MSLYLLSNVYRNINNKKTTTYLTHLKHFAKTIPSKDWTSSTTTGIYHQVLQCSRVQTSLKYTSFLDVYEIRKIAMIRCKIINTFQKVSKFRLVWLKYRTFFTIKVRSMNHRSKNIRSIYKSPIFILTNIVDYDS